jgi:predicted Zn-dependent protease
MIMSKRALLTILCPFLWLCIGCAINPITGEEEIMFFPERDDVAIGQKYAPEIEKELGGKIDNPQLQNYIDFVGQKVARVSHSPDWDYHFVALKDKAVNAVSLPGGYVFITKGMLKKMDSEAQLAAVLSHEVAHVVARDAANVMSTQIGIDVLLSAATTGKAQGDVMTAANFARQILSLRYSREDEETADQTGLEYMVRAGYNPYSMIETMQMLQNQHEGGPTDILSTHPAPQNRIMYLREKIQTRYPSVTGLKIGKEDYHSNVLDRLSN